MKNGNWAPLSKALVSKLPKTRGFTYIEAVFALQVSFDNSDQITVSGLAKRWDWSRRQVRKLFDDLGIEITYPETTQKIQKQSGQISVQKADRNRTESGQIRFINSKDIEAKPDRKRTETGQKPDRSADTINDPINPNPNPDPRERKKAPPEIFHPSKKLITWSAAKGVSLNRLTVLIESCFDWHRANGIKRVDWEATIRNWIKKEKTFQKPKTNKTDQFWEDQFDDDNNRSHQKSTVIDYRQPQPGTDKEPAYRLVCCSQ